MEKTWLRERVRRYRLAEISWCLSRSLLYKTEFLYFTANWRRQKPVISFLSLDLTF